MSAARFDWEAARARVERFRDALDQAAGESFEKRERIFQERAERLARAEGHGAASAAYAVIVFRMGVERYALPLSSLSEVLPEHACAAVPGAPERLAGVIQVRGEIRPVLDLARLLEIGPLEEGAGGSLLLVRSRGREFGLRIGQVEDIRVLTEQERGAAPAGAAKVQWITPDLISVLDPDSLFEEDVR